MGTQNLQNVNEPVKTDDSAKLDQQDNANANANASEQASEAPYLGTWKTREAAEEGLANLQKLLDSQGNELGLLRKQTEFFQKQIEGMGNQPKPENKENQKGPDYAQEMQAIQKQMDELDPDEPDYQQELGKLIVKSNRLAAEKAKQDALNAAQSEFKKILDERDIQATQKEFYREHPDFNEPEMQMRIQERIATDPTGMADPLSAYWEIKAQDAANEKAMLEEQAAEMQRLLNLKQGEENTGKVVTKGQGPGQQKTKQTKATGADLDRGMMEALQKAKNAS